ncbi:MAG TPA: DUF5719 family protein [Dermatophilaceae bacterium]|nr:DUF5719 family protein [Dermatophilaceae bacterium]
MIGVARCLLVTAAGGGLVVGATNLPVDLDFSHSYNRVAPAAQTAPVRTVTLVCPGPEVDGGSTGAADAAGGPAANRVVVAAPAPATLLGSTGRGSLAMGGLPTGGSWPGGARRAAVSATPRASQAVQVLLTGALAPGASAVQRSVTTTGTSRALIMAPCLPPTSQAWLVGGGSQAGRRERLVLANSAPNPVTVDVSVLGAAGPVASPGGEGLVVPGYGRTVLLLDGIAGQESAPVVRVTARGGTVAATLNDTWLDGLVPRGGDDVVGTVGPSREQVLPAWSLSGAGTIRVAVPGEDEAVVQVRLLTPDGPRALPRDGVVRVAGRTVRDIAVAGVPAGAYAVQVRSDRPVLAGALAERRAAGAGPSDFAWSAAAPPITGLGGSPLPTPLAGLTNELHLAVSGSGGPVTVTTVDKSGTATSRAVRVPDDAVSTVPLGPATAVWVSPGDVKGVRAGVVSTMVRPDGVLLSSIPLTDLALTVTQPGLLQLP